MSSTLFLLQAQPHTLLLTLVGQGWMFGTESSVGAYSGPGSLITGWKWWAGEGLEQKMHLAYFLFQAFHMAMANFRYRFIWGVILYILNCAALRQSGI